MAIRVPVTPSIESRGIGAPTVNVDSRGAFGEDIGAAVAQVGKSLSAAGGEVGKAYKEERDKSDVAAAVNAETELERRANAVKYGQTDASQKGDLVPGLNGLDTTGADPVPVPNGFLNLKGESALAAAQQTKEWVRKSQNDLAQGLNPRARELFLSRTQKLLVDHDKTVEQHVGQQVQAIQQAAAVDRAAEAQRSLSLNPGDAEARDTAIAAAEGPLAALAVSKEDREAKLTAWRSDAARTVLSAMLDRKVPDVQGARAFLDGPLFSKGESPTVRQVLGPEAEKFQKVIDGEQLRVDAEHVSQSLVEQLRAKSPDGRVDPYKAFDLVDKYVPAEDEARRAEIKGRLKERLALEQDRWTAETKDISNRAFAVYNKSGFYGIPTPLREQLNTRNPELYNRLKDEAEAKWRRSQEKKENASKAQSDLDQKLFYDYMTLPPEERAGLDVGNVFTAQGGSAKGVARIAAQQQQDKQSIQKGAAVREDDFVQAAKANGQGLVANDKNAGKALEAEARIAFGRFVQDKGKPPTRDEEKALLGELLAPKVQQRSFFGVDWLAKDKPEYEFQRRARERQQRKDEGVPEPQPDVVTKTPAVLPPRAERVAQLRAQGKTSKEVIAIMRAEGYQ